ncbi:MAG: sugar phosphate nucleotidyltransferase, partial [Armatimonadota bacterium]
MKTAILVGGKGTRLFAEQTDMPKALYEIGNRPILWHIMKMYEAHGFREFLLLLGYKADKIVDYVLHRQPFEGRDVQVTLAKSRRPTIIDPDGEQPPWTISLCHTGLESPKGERIRRVRNYIGDDENFMVTYGDGLSDLDISDLVEFHKAHGKIATITAVRTDSQFGHLQLDESRVT